MEYIAAAALGDSHQERWRELVDEFEHLRKNPDEECCLVSAGDFAGRENKCPDP